MGKKKKFMMAVTRDQMRVIKRAARKRYISVQEIIRVMVPEWLEHERAKARR